MILLFAALVTSTVTARADAMSQDTLRKNIVYDPIDYISVSRQLQLA
jgi:hypothetical protein